MKTKNLLLTLVIVLVGGILAACGGGNAEGQACSEVEVGDNNGTADLKGCTLRVAVENTYPPFNYIDTESGEGIGYDYDVFAEICGIINCAPEYVETSWDQMVAIMSGEGQFDTFDVGADGITITEERAQHVDFSNAYISTTQAMLVRLDESRFVEPAEFAGDSELLVGSQPGTTNYETAVDLVGEDRILAYDQFGTAVQALINGEVDAVIIDNVAGIGYVGANADKVKLTGEPLASDGLGFIFSQGSPLTAAVNDALAEMESNGKLGELADTWMTPSE